MVTSLLVWSLLHDLSQVRAVLNGMPHLPVLLGAILRTCVAILQHMRQRRGLHQLAGMHLLPWGL
jgi:hypothetical protein